MKPIYRKATYLFYITIKVNDVAVDIKNDVVTVYLGKTYNMKNPIITKVCDVATEGLTGKAVVEFSATETEINKGTYYLQALWELDGTERKFLVIDTTVTVKEQIKL